MYIGIGVSWSPLSTFPCLGLVDGFAKRFFQALEGRAAAGEVVGSNPEEAEHGASSLARSPLSESLRNRGCAALGSDCRQHADVVQESCSAFGPPPADQPKEFGAEQERTPRGLSYSR